MPLLDPDRRDKALPLFLTLCLGIAGALAGEAAGLPLGLLLGSLLAVGGAAVAGFKPGGRLPYFPPQIRNGFVPIIGVSIGGAFRPEVFREALNWWPSLLALFLFIPVVHLLGYRVLNATGKLDRVTCFFGTAPGGLLDTVQMGEERGADVAMLATLQFMRLILTIVFVPLAFSLMTGHAVGSAGGAQLPGADAPLGPQDAAVLIAAGVIGAVLARRLRIPAGIITLPMAVSAVAHLTGLTQAAPPYWMVSVTQVVVGTTLGVRFAGMPVGAFWLALRLSALNVSLTIAVAALVAQILGPLVDEPRAAVFLAFAPGGLTEMSLVALSLGISVIYVTAHHVVRIVLAVTVAGVASKRLGF